MSENIKPLTGNVPAISISEPEGESSEPSYDDALDDLAGDVRLLLANRYEQMPSPMVQAQIQIVMLTSLKISLVLIPIAMLLVVGTYMYSLWDSERQKAADFPVEGTDVLMRDLLAFHKKRGGFPRDLKKMEGVVWEKKESRSHSNNRRGITRRHYYYLYTPVGHHRFTLWAIPIGRQREDAATWFLVVTPESQRRWKGGALSPDGVKGLSLDPLATELSLMGLIEQPNTVSK